MTAFHRGDMRLPLIFTVGSLWLLVADFSNQFRIGPISVGGALTLSTAVFAIAGCVSRPRKPISHRSPNSENYVVRKRVPILLVAFAFWTVLTLPLNSGLESLQNVAVYVSFVATMILASLSDRAALGMRVQRLFLGSALASSSLYAITTLIYGLDNDEIYHARSIALVALMGLSLCLMGTGGRSLAVVFLGVILLSLSRTALFVGFGGAAIGMAMRSGTRSALLKVVVAFITLGSVLWILVTRFAPLRVRFLEGDNALGYDGVQFNTSGRVELWSATLRSAGQHIWFGSGPGSAEELISEEFVRISHPHNDYLRILHDFGIVGLTLFAAGIIAVLWTTLKFYRKSSDPIHLAAFLMTLMVSAIAVTDNVLVYPFVMVPLGALVGASYASGDATYRRPFPTEGVGRASSIRR